MRMRQRLIEMAQAEMGKTSKKKLGNYISLTKNLFLYKNEFIRFFIHRTQILRRMRSHEELFVIIYMRSQYSENLKIKSF